MKSGICRKNILSLSELDCARLVRRIIKETKRQFEHLTNEKQFPLLQEWVYSCFNVPELQEVKMAELNELLGFYGVESVSYKFNRKYDNEVYSFDYLNGGDTYSTTLIRFPGGRYIISSWGDEVERLERKGAETGDYTTLKYS